MCETLLCPYRKRTSLTFSYIQNIDFIFHKKNEDFDQRKTEKYNTRNLIHFVLTSTFYFLFSHIERNFYKENFQNNVIPLFAKILY